MKQRKYQPHQQLRTIRKTLEKTQKQFAEMLEVSYPYLLSVETGQRPMSDALARKIAWAVGVTNIAPESKTATPLSFDNQSKKLVSFSLETYRQHRAQLPKFRTSGDEDVTPSVAGYAKVFHVVLDVAMSTHRLGLVFPRFLDFFSDTINSGALVGEFHHSLQKLYPKDAEALKAATAVLAQTHIKPSDHRPAADETG